MFPVRVRVALAGLAVAGGGIVATLLGPAGPAVGQSSQPIQAQVQLSSPATLVARGAGVDVTATANCSGASAVIGTVSVTLNERTSTAFGSATVNCTGTNQTIQVLVTPPVGRPLKKGTALANATMNVFCNPGPQFCGSQQIQTTIQVDG